MKGFYHERYDIANSKVCKPYHIHKLHWKHGTMMEPLIALWFLNDKLPKVYPTATAYLQHRILISTTM
jgi:hypothetical protein